MLIHLFIVPKTPNISQLGVDFAFVFWIKLVLQVSKCRGFLKVNFRQISVNLEILASFLALD